MKRLGETSAAAISVTETVDLDDMVAQGAAQHATFLVYITTITGTWTVVANKRGPASTSVTIASEAFTTPGFHVIALTSEFSSGNGAVLMPDQLVFVEDVSGTLTAEVFMVTA